MQPQEKVFTFITALSRTLENNPFLQRLANGQASLEEWQQWGIQKYLSSQKFISVLKSCHQKAKQEGLSRTMLALHENLCDEEGLHRVTGEPLKIGAHESWRINFYDALGLNSAVLQQAKPILATTLHSDAYAHVIEKFNAWEHLGVFIALEYIIGKEMELIEAGLEHTPVLQPIFDRNTEHGRKSRLYITHHAAHDLNQHFPEILDAAVDDLGEKFQQVWNDLQAGATFITQKRVEHYDGIAAICNLPHLSSTYSNASPLMQ